MTTKITSIYDAIIDKLEAILPARTRIPNPYELLDNPYQFLKNGWGLRYDGGERLPFEICNRRDSHSFAIILTQEFLRVESRQDSFDDPTKSLLEDIHLCKEAFFAVDNIGNQDIMKIDVTTNTPLEAASGDKYNLLKIEVAVIIEFFEEII